MNLISKITNSNKDSLLLYDADKAARKRVKKANTIIKYILRSQAILNILIIVFEYLFSK